MCLCGFCCCYTGCEISHEQSVLESSKKETTIKGLNRLRAIVFYKIMEIRSYKPSGNEMVEDLDTDPKVAIYKQMGPLIIFYNFF